MRRRRVTIQGMGRPALVRDVVTSTLSLSLWHQVRLPEELSSRVKWTRSWMRAARGCARIVDRDVCRTRARTRIEQMSTQAASHVFGPRVGTGLVRPHA